jgi:MscS family membrane protein
VTRTFAAAVFLLAALAPVAAEQAPPTTAAPATTTTTQPARAVEPGPDTPRGAMTRFLAFCREGQYTRAADFLNLRNIPTSKRAVAGPELASQLEAVLDRVLWIDVYKLSDQTEGYPDDGLPPYVDSLGIIEASTGTVELTTERVRQAGSSPVWKIAASSVALIPTLYDEFGWGPLANLLPAPFFEIRLFQIRLWQWIGLLLIAGVAWLVAWLFRHLVVQITRVVLARRQAAFDPKVAEHASGPLRLLLGLVVFTAGARLLGLAVPVQRVVIGAEVALAIVAITWLVMRVVDMVSSHFERTADRDRHTRAITTIPLVRRTLKVFVATLAMIAALQNFGFNVTGILAGLGIGGLAVALAAQKTVENLFGSVSLIADQPVRVGDVCRFGEVVGTVEDIGLRSTRVRTLDRTVVTVPNGQFSNMALENLSRRDRIPVRATIALPPGTGGESVRKVLGALRETIAKHPKVDVHSIRTRFTKMDPKALEVEVSAYVRTVRWDEFVEAREQIFLSALDVVEASGIGLK